MRVNNEEIFTIPYLNDDKRRIIYVPLRSYLALVDFNISQLLLSDKYSEEKESFFNNLKQRPLLDIDEIIKNIHLSNPELSLALTDNCNLRCVYCHASAGEAHKLETMSELMVDSILKKYFEFIKPSKYVKISFDGGGEPTFNFELLKYAINSAKEYAKVTETKCKFSMATNGFYGKNIREFIVNEFSHVSLSFDGPEHVHDKHRPTQNGKGSFSTVFETAKYFEEAKLSFAFRATISDYSLKYFEEIIDFFIDNFPNKSLGLEHLNSLGRAINCTEVLPPNKEIFTKILLNILEYTKNKPIKILNSASTEYDIIRPVFCSNVGIPNWTVNIKGEIAACARDNVPDEFIFGKFNSVSKELVFDKEKLINLQKMNVKNYPECAECFCKYHCAGDCPDRRMTDKFDCKSIQEIGVHILNDKINNKEVQHANTISSPGSGSN